MPVLISAVASETRLAQCRQWLAARAPEAEILVVGATAEAAGGLLREGGAKRGGAFGWHRASLGQLAAALATPALVEANLVPVGQLGAQAVTTRVVFELAQRGALGRYAKVGQGPGFARAVAATLAELRLARVTPDAVGNIAPELRTLLEAYAAGLASAGLADRPQMLVLAGEAASDGALHHPLLGLPTLLLDVAIHTAAERDLVGALAARSPDFLVSCAAGDRRTLDYLIDLGFEVQPDCSAVADTSLGRLQAHLFEDSAVPRCSPGDDLSVLSAPGESRECVEIARQIVQLARQGTPFDQMAILLRSPQEYRPHLVEALGRAQVPAYFSRGMVKPNPAGRAFLALLGCAAEGLSAHKFAEYLSLGEVPRATPEGAPPEAPSGAERWVAPDEEMVPRAVAQALEDTVTPVPEEGLEDDPSLAPVAAGTLRTPRKWESLLVEAAVIGGRDRWARRLTGLERELQADLQELDDPDEPPGERIRGDLAAIQTLRDFALPLLDDLAGLPQGANWGQWLDCLSALASRALRQPDTVQRVLAELAPMGEVGPIGLREVILVLERRLLEVTEDMQAARYGRVFVAPIEAARGTSFDVVFIPGMAERLFPRKIAEEPILLDAARRELGDRLPTNADRVGGERLQFRIAVGAARTRLVLSYPRIELAKSRPRVPSFYSLEALRAAEGSLPDFNELAARAERATDARIGWPAPKSATDAIDEAEHDLALLDALLELDPDKSVGHARYLLNANPHLGRALRFRARRWLRRWTPADGLVEPSEGAREAMLHHRLDARSFSPTALQNYAACPYKFFLYAVHKLAPREEAEAIDEMDPLQRGSLVHETQFELYGRLQEAQLLPVGPANLAAARQVLDAVLDEVAARYKDDLAPAIERVWADGIAAIRADLREWLRRVSEDDSGFAPWRFELAFGLAGGRDRDPHSTPDPVPLGNGLQLRGSIDLVERDPDGRLRLTDHKTGKNTSQRGQVVAGGESLQPVLYALAAEQLFPEDAVESGRLYFCTARGGFADHVVPLGPVARQSAGVVAEVIGEALEKPFLPAAPAERKCAWCDYLPVCGPAEELRTARKPRAQIEPLLKLRELK